MFASVHRAAALQNLYNFGNDVAPLFDQYPVADSQVETSDFILVVQCGPADGAAREFDGFQVGDRG
jgi:hypothetical protein